MAKVKNKKGRRGFTFYKELGGAPARDKLSKTSRVLIDNELIQGRVLDYGCGKGFDADSQGWSAYDPHYRQTYPTGQFNTIIVNHVANILTSRSRTELYSSVNELLADGGIAYISVARNIPKRGKAGVRRRLQNYVVLTLPSVFCDDEEEIYALEKNAVFKDKTKEFEGGL